MYPRSYTTHFDTADNMVSSTRRSSGRQLQGDTPHPQGSLRSQVAPVVTTPAEAHIVTAETLGKDLKEAVAVISRLESLGLHRMKIPLPKCVSIFPPPTLPPPL